MVNTKAAIAYYVRTSTHRQDGTAQFHAIRQRLEHEYGDGTFAAAKAYTDIGYTGRHDRRPALRELRRDASRGLLASVYIHSWSRLYRGTLGFATVVGELDAAGVRVVSIESPLDTSTPGGRLTRDVLAAVAAFERDCIVERVRDGLAAAVARGQTLGRPKTVSDEQLGEAVALRDQGLHWHHISDRVGVPRETIRRAVAAYYRAEGETEQAPH